MWSRIARDNLKACLPFKPFLRRVLRKVSPYRSLPANDQLAIEHGLKLIRFIRDYEIGARTILEVGTGWIPTIPQTLKAYGAERIFLTDIDRLCDSNTFKHAGELVRKSLSDLIEVSGADQEQLKANLSRLNVEEYRCPPHLDKLPSRSVDLIYSRTVLEHIPEPKLKKLLNEWKRLLKPGGYCIHFIDNSDHFEHQDKSLSRLNFLSLSDVIWRVACFNPQNYQNRLRHSDYISLLCNAGYELVHVCGQPDQQALADLERLAVRGRFAHYEKSDLAVLTSIIVAKKSFQD
jgi:SAM-dependent methyltransferase